MKETWLHPPPLRPKIAAKVRTAVLFDIDGTLVNARGTSKAMVAALADVYQVEIDAEGYYMGGRTDAQIALELLARSGLDTDRTQSRLDDAWQRYLTLLDESFAATPPYLYEGAWELLERLARRAHATTGLLTGNQRLGAWRKLSAVGVDGYFRTGAFGDESSERNALPSVALQRLEVLLRRKLPPSNVVIVGDTPADIRCARHAGCRVIAVATGRHDSASLAEHAPDALFEDLTDTNAILAALNSMARS